MERGGAFGMRNKGVSPPLPFTQGAGKRKEYRGACVYEGRLPTTAYGGASPPGRVGLAGGI